MFYNRKELRTNLIVLALILFGITALPNRDNGDVLTDGVPTTPSLNLIK